MKDQFETGSSSARTHRLTQPSSTLNRRYVGRPTNLAIEEAARMADYLEQHSPAAPGRPSRLVNLRVHNDDLENIRAAMEKEKAEKARKASEQTQIAKASIAHKVVELGGESLPPAPEPKDDESVVMDLSTGLAEQPSEDASTFDSGVVIDDISEHDLAAIAEDDAFKSQEETPSVAMPTIRTSANLPPIKNADIDTRALAMSIAADYTAATLGATMANLPTGIDEVDTDDLNQAAAEAQAAESIDQIANTVAGYVNKIRESKDPEEVSLTIKDLKDYAEAIKQNSDLPEIAELGDTIEKFITVTEKSTGIRAASQKKPAITPRVERAATKVSKSTNKIALNAARSAKKSAATKTGSTGNQALMTAKAVKASQTLARTNSTISLNARGRHAMRPANMVSAKTRNPSSSRKQNNDEALRKTMRNVARMEESSEPSDMRRKSVRKKGRVKRFVLAFSCAAACVAGIVYVVSTNIPDISVRVAAMQAGVDSSYPSYVPTEFSLTDIKSDDKEIILTFTNANEQSFTLSEKKSAWDSAALERNLVKKEWNDDYSTTHEQGITMYIHSSSAVWVNGGVLYQISAKDDVLTKKQLRSIATSMQ